MAFEHVHALHHFQTVADVVPQRGVHIGDHGSYPAAMAVSYTHLGQRGLPQVQSLDVVACLVLQGADVLHDVVTGHVLGVDHAACLLYTSAPPAR